MTKILIILVIAFTFEAFGVIALKKGLNEIGAQYTARKTNLPVWKNVVTLVGNWFTQPGRIVWPVAGDDVLHPAAIPAQPADVSFVWPLTAISFVLTTLAAQFLLH